MNLGLKGKQIFLTGGTGFIGSRLAQCLVSAYGAEVHALVRRVGTVGAARLARLAGVKMFYGDALDPEAVNKASEGCSLFIHCAIGTSGSPRQRKRVTVDGTRTVLDAASRQGAERFLYVSSASVHDPARSGEIIHEECPQNGRGLARDKVLAERLVMKYQQRQGLPVVILRPTCVWGPFSPVWTLSAAQLIRQKIPFLPMGGRGIANVVYIDNLVDAIALSLIKDEALGQTFLVNDDEPGTWAELYGAYAQCLNVPLYFRQESNVVGQIVKVSVKNMALVALNLLRGNATLGFGALREIYDNVPLAKLLASQLPERIQDHLRQFETRQAPTSKRSSVPSRSSGNGALSHPFIMLSRSTRDLYESHSRYSNEKAKRLLGWKSGLTFTRSLAITAQWLHHTGHRDESLTRSCLWELVPPAIR